jgi:hypothetical protein
MWGDLLTISAALERLRTVAIPGHPTAYAPMALLATRDLVEAAAQAGALAGMEPLVARFERWAQAGQRTWTLAVAHRSRTLMSQGEEAERHYEAALTVEEPPLLELARTELVYGMWPRRERRRAEARVHLRAALDAYERFDATLRARNVLSYRDATSPESSRTGDSTTKVAGQQRY